MLFRSHTQGEGVESRELEIAKHSEPFAVAAASAIEIRDFQLRQDADDYRHATRHGRIRLWCFDDVGPSE